MTSTLMHDRGRGPELVGTRITVFALLPYFLDPTVTEEYIGQLYGLTREQIAAARAYVLNHPDTVLADHLKIEERLAAGNPPEVIESAKESHRVLMKFKEWLERRDEIERQERDAAESSGRGLGNSPHFPSFREWLAQNQSRPTNGT